MGACRCTICVQPLLVLLTFSAGDASAASQLSEQEVNERVQLYVDMEDPDILLDFRSLNSGKKVNTMRFGTKFRNSCRKM